ncbi:MAG: hypothetical protein OXB95_06555 [Rhodobacteraceae bacterium]|nr:hypothetical protein [Paracoccaceae bacterium]
MLDNSVKGMVFRGSNDLSSAASKFLKRVENGELVLAIGGKLKKELIDNKPSGKIAQWFAEAIRSGKVREFAKDKVKKEERQLKKGGLCLSNDHHVLGLARISGARLLFTDDKDLMKDFKNLKLIPKPKGKVYRVPDNGKFDKSHEKLLSETNCKPAGG